MSPTGVPVLGSTEAKAASSAWDAWNAGALSFLIRSFTKEASGEPMNGAACGRKKYRILLSDHPPCMYGGAGEGII